MKKSIRFVMGALVVALAVFGCASYSPSSGWVALIDDGKGLENFTRNGDANWRTEGGVIVADKSTTKGASVLVSKQSFRDVEIYVEFWAGHDTNSGVYATICGRASVSDHVALGQVDQDGAIV